MNSNLNIEVNDHNPEGDYTSVVFSGDFDKAGFYEVRDSLSDCVKKFEGKYLVFDFSALRFINSEGIGYLMEVHAHLSQRDRKLIVIGANSHVLDVFKTIGIAEVVPVYASLNDFLNKV